MESHVKKQRGQLVIELSMALSILTLILFLALKGGILIKKKFKHDFVTPTTTPEFEVEFNKNIFFTTLKDLKYKGWEIERRTGIEKNWFFMKKGNQKLLFANKLGVLL